MSPLIRRFLEADRLRREDARLRVGRLRKADREALVMVCNGHASDVIGQALGVPVTTVKHQFTRINRLLETSSLTEAAVVAEQGGLV